MAGNELDIDLSEKTYLKKNSNFWNNDRTTSNCYPLSLLSVIATLPLTHQAPTYPSRCQNPNAPTIPLFIADSSTPANMNAPVLPGYVDLAEDAGTNRGVHQFEAHLASSRPPKTLPCLSIVAPSYLSVDWHQSFISFSFFFFWIRVFGRGIRAPNSRAG